MILKVEHVKKSFDGNVVFDDFSMEVQKNEFVAIIGSSGSGKSTLLNMIGLLEKPDQGNIMLFQEENIRPFSRKAQGILKEKIGYLFQNFALVENKTVFENLAMAIQDRKVLKKEKIAEVLEKVGLSGFENKKIFKCSGGEQQRIAIARLFLKPCELILADEPTGSLDEDNKQVVFSFLRELQKDGKTLIVVTHDIQLAELADRLIEI